MTQGATISFELDGKTISLRTGRMAKQATGACEVYCGDTMVLVTATESKQPKEGIDYFPLLVDYEEKLYAVGRVPGSFGRREGKAPDKAVLTSRLIDRPIRPLFVEGYRNDVQIVATAMSADQENPTDMLAMLGASVAIGLAGLPFNGPIGAVRVARVNGKFVANPSYQQIEESDIDIVIAGTENSIMMVEAGCKVVSEKDVLAAIDYGHQYVKRQVEVQRSFFKGLSNTRREFEAPQQDEELKRLIVEHATSALKRSMSGVTDKAARAKLCDEAQADVEEAIANLPEDHHLKAVSDRQLGEYLECHEAELMRAQVLDTGVRADGRRCDEIRPITVEVSLLPRTHGTGLFTRGTTQVLSRGHAWYRQRRATARFHRSSNRKALHASLQLPGLLGR